MSPVRGAIRPTLFVLATAATLAPLAAHAVITKTRAADQADVTSQTLASGRGTVGDQRVAGYSGPALSVYFGPFTMDDAVLRDDGQSLSAAVRALALEISGEYVAAYPKRAFADLDLSDRARGAGSLVVIGRGIGNPSTGQRGRGYRDPGQYGSSQSGRDLGHSVLVAEPPTASLVAFGLGMLLMGLRRRAERDRR